MQHHDSSNKDYHALLAWYNRLEAEKTPYLSLWEDCYHYGRATANGPSQRRRIYDSTAMDAVDCLASHLMAEITPAWSPWFRLMPGRSVAEHDQGPLRAELDHYQGFLRGVFEHSHFYSEIYQAYLDLIIAGTACILIESSPLEEESQLHFRALPVPSFCLEENERGQITTLMWRQTVHQEIYMDRFPHGPELNQPQGELLHIYRQVREGYCHDILLLNKQKGALLEQNIRKSCPFVAFRWQKSGGHVYGTSPMMKVLPDVKTANKIIELTLKNASIAVSGIWQVEDDGTVNPATLELKPGAIIPKATGSSGLTPLAPSGRFDLSQLLLDNLHTRIRRGLFVERLAQRPAPHQSATEVVSRATETARILGALYTRLFSECLSPLLKQTGRLLAEAGYAPSVPLDGQNVMISFLSPLHQAHQGRTIAPVLTFIETLTTLHPGFLEFLDFPALRHWLAKQMDIPADFRAILNNAAAQQEHAITS